MCGEHHAAKAFFFTLSIHVNGKSDRSFKILLTANS